jgi:Tol biopolymer transport system component
VKKAVFRNVKLEQLAPSSGKLALVSTLETVAIDSAFRNVEYAAAAHFEAPNWTRDGKAFIFNQDGTIRRLEVGGKEPAVIPTAPLDRCNNDHGISPDGQWLAVSSQSADDQASRVYLVSIAGGTPRLVTKTGGAYWHGWSPDGKTLAFAARRGDQMPIFSIALDGSHETQLTTAPGLNDGPDYSPDGAWIYFNSVRTGQMQIWRMKPDGSAQQQFLFSDSNDWFPHISPDGQWMVYLSFDKSVNGHPPNKDVELRLMSLKDGRISVLARLFGGQGTINVPSWSPDSKKVAFVSYELLPEEDLTAQ